MPNFFMITIPMAYWWGCCWGEPLAADSEIIAMRASGLGIGYFVRVALIVAIGGTLLGTGQFALFLPRAPIRQF